MAELLIELISVGDEILIGHTLDTNSNWIAKQLSDLGFRLRWHSTVGDNASDMRHQLRRAWNRADAVITTGGLGPTHDDITRPVAADFFEDELIVRKDLQQRIEDRFAARGLKPPKGYDAMAEFPTRAESILNEHGSAPGIHFSEDGKDFFALPGVPVEMKEMVLNYIIPKLEEKRQGAYKHHVFKTTGIGESHLNEIIGDAIQLEPVRLAYLPSIDHGVSLRLSMFGDDESEVEQLLKDRVQRIRELIKEYIFTEDSRSLPEVILDLFRKKNWKLSIAESCTGGMVCDKLISVAGSSDVLERGFITYSNESKMELLGVPEKVLIDHGAVSEETAIAMAEGAREKAGANAAISITGVAGPSGGTEEKPVGLVYIGYSDKNETIAKRFRFNGGRDTNRRRSALAALTLLWKKNR